MLEATTVVDPELGAALLLVLGGVPGPPPAGAPAADEESLFDSLVARHRDDVFRIVLSVLGPGFAPDAEDVTQDVLVKLYRALPAFRGESRLSTWLYRVAFRAAVDRKRLARYRKTHVGDDVLAGVPAPAGVDPLTTAMARQQRRRLLRRVDRLPDAQRAAVLLHYWMGLDVGEVARTLALPEGTIKSHLHRARERLRAELEESR